MSFELKFERGDMTTYIKITTVTIPLYVKEVNCKCFETSMIVINGENIVKLDDEKDMEAMAKASYAKRTDWLYLLYWLDEHTELATRKSKKI